MRTELNPLRQLFSAVGQKQGLHEIWHEFYSTAKKSLGMRGRDISYQHSVLLDLAASLQYRNAAAAERRQFQLFLHQSCQKHWSHFKQGQSSRGLETVFDSGRTIATGVCNWTSSSAYPDLLLVLPFERLPNLCEKRSFVGWLHVTAASCEVIERLKPPPGADIFHLFRERDFSIRVTDASADHWEFIYNDKERYQQFCELGYHFTWLSSIARRVAHYEFCLQFLDLLDYSRRFSVEGTAITKIVERLKESWSQPLHVKDCGYLPPRHALAVSWRTLDRIRTCILQRAARHRFYLSPIEIEEMNQTPTVVREGAEAHEVWSLVSPKLIGWSLFSCPEATRQWSFDSFSQGNGKTLE